MPVALNDIFNENYHADKVIERQLKLHKKWGSRDRKVFAESIYSIVRHWRKYLTQLGLTWSDTTTEKVPEELFLKVLYLELQAKDIDWPQWLKLPNVHNFRPCTELCERESIPDWIDELGRMQFAENWPEVIHQLNQQAHIYLRVNTLKTDAQKLMLSLQEDGVEAEAVNDQTIRLTKRANVFRTQAFKLGLFEVQDYGSQKIAEFLNPQAKDRVWDACAGAGGKTLHMACLMGNKGKIIASDIHEWKLNELKKRAKRNSIDVIEARVVDGKLIKRMQNKFDKLLLDVPCSGLGVLRRNPDTKWKMSLDRIAELGELQEEILSKYSTTVKPGGEMVYATCSFLDSENIDQVSLFLSNNKDWELVSAKSILPSELDSDAFFMAKMLKKL